MSAPAAGTEENLKSSPPWTVERIGAIPLFGHDGENLESEYEYDEDEDVDSSWPGPSAASTASSGGWTAVVSTDSSSPGGLRLTAWYDFPVVVDRSAGDEIGAAGAAATGHLSDNGDDYGTGIRASQQRVGMNPVTPVVRVTRALAWPPRASGSASSEEALSQRVRARTAVEIATATGGSTSTGVVRAYAAHPITGDVVTWSLPLVDDEPRRPFPSSTPLDTIHSDALVKLPVNSNAKERITSLDFMTTAQAGAGADSSTGSTPVAVGTSWGHLYWIQRTANPVTLQAWRVGAESSSSSSEPASAAGSALAGLFHMASWLSPAPKPKKPRLSPPSSSSSSSLVPSPPHRTAPMTGPPRLPPQSTTKGGGKSSPTGPGDDLAVVRAVLLVPFAGGADATRRPTGNDSKGGGGGGNDRSGRFAVVRRRAVEVWSVQGPASHPSFRCAARTDLPKLRAQFVQSRRNAPHEDGLFDGLLAASSRIVAATSEGPATPTQAGPDKLGLHLLVKSDAGGSALDDADFAGESLYWVKLDVTASDGEPSIRSAVPLPQGKSLQLPPSHSWACMGMQVSEDGAGYVALCQMARSRSPQYSSSNSNEIVPITQDRSVVLAIDNDDKLHSSTPSSNVIHSFDLVAAGVGALLTPIQLDVATPGCVLFTTTGDRIRLRFARNVDAPVRLDAPSALNAEVDPSVVAKMVQQLRDAVRDLLDDPFHFPSGIELASLSRLLPTPKVPTLDGSMRLMAHVESAILQLSRQELRRHSPYDPEDEMQMRMTPALAYGKLERHESFIVLMQRGGLYRALSVAAKVELFAIGQQLKVFAAFIAAGSDASPRSDRLSQFVASLTSPHDLDEWLEEMETAAVRGNGRTPGSGMNLAELICESITAAAAHKSSRLQSLYGVSEGNVREMLPTTPLWPCRPHFQRMLLSQLRRWMNESPQGPESNSGNAWVETIAVAALQSFRDSYEAANRAPPAEIAYAEVQDVAIPLLECVASSDELAWRLSIEHGYFRGLCVIARRHEHRNDRGLYKLEPLFKHFNGKSSAGKPGIPFCHFVLDWHAKESLLGHVLEYGKHCPGALSALLVGNRDYEDLRQFQWIHSIRHGDNDKAAESLLSNAKNQGSTLADVRVDLALATLSNRLAAGSSFVSDRLAEIVSLRNLIVIQEELFGRDNDISAENQRSLSPEELLKVVFNKVSSRVSGDVSVAAAARLLLLGLHVCTALHTTTDIQHRACQVWLAAIQRDQDWLTKTFEGGTSPFLALSPEMVELLQERTVFGSLLVQFANREVDGTLARLWRDVSYTSVEKQVGSSLPSATLAKGIATLAKVTATATGGKQIHVSS